MDSRMLIALGLTVLFGIGASIVLSSMRCCTCGSEISDLLTPRMEGNTTIIDVDLDRPERVSNLKMVRITLRIGDYTLPLACDNCTWIGSLNGCDYIVQWIDRDLSGDLNSDDALKITTSEPPEANIWLYLAVEGYHGVISCKIAG